MNELQLILIDHRNQLTNAWQKHFDGLPDYRIHRDGFESLKTFDCVITPGNSFGIMDGGFDYIMTEFFGTIVQKRVQTRIRDEYLGELPVGNCLIVDTDHTAHPFLGYAPTMRVPMDIDQTDYAYVSLWAALTAIHRYNQTHDQKIKQVACPGLGTGTGHIPPHKAAYHMAQAWKNYKQPPEILTWKVADERHYHIEFVGKHLRPE